MQPFVQTYRSIILERYVDVLGDAYGRALGQARHRTDQDRDGIPFQHADVVQTVVLPVVERHIRRGLYTADHLYTLLQLCAPVTRRFRSHAGELLQNKATAANKQAWKELRNLLGEQPALAQATYVDWSLDPTYWQPLLSHLARETILWAYAASIYGPDDPVPADLLSAYLGGSAHAPMLPRLYAGRGLDWGPVMHTLMEELRADMGRRGLTPSYVALDDVTLSTDQPHWAAFAFGPPFARTYEFNDVQHLRAFISTSSETQTQQRDDFARALAYFDFSCRLLLHFAYTGYTHLCLTTPEGNVAAIRAAIMQALTQLGFQAAGDPDLGEALGWLATLSDQRQHFGDTFDRRLRTALARAFTNARDEQVEARCHVVISAIQDLVTEAPDLETSQWLQTLGPWNAPDPGRCTTLASSELAATFQQKLQQDTSTLFLRAGVPVPVSTVRLAEMAFSEQDLASVVLLAELREAYDEFQTYASLNSMIPQRVRKYFTALCRNQDKGLNSVTVMTVKHWLAVTEGLCTTSAAPILAHYAPVWLRLSRLPVPASDVVPALQALQPLLAPVPGLPQPGAAS